MRFHRRIDRLHPFRCNRSLLFPQHLGAAQQLPVQVGIIEMISIHQGQAADSYPGQDFGDRSTEAAETDHGDMAL